MMYCSCCEERIFQPYSGPMWIDGEGSAVCAAGGRHEPDDGKPGE